MAGVLCVITARDVPGSNCLFGRFPVLAEDEVRYVGDAVACVAAEDVETAQRAIRRIRVEYRKIPGVYTWDDVRNPDLAPVHADRPGNEMENTRYRQYAGDIETGFSESDVTVEAVYETPFAVNGYLERDSVVVAEDYLTGDTVVYGCIQNLYSIRAAVCEALSLPTNRVRVVQTTIGGSFGGKNETSVALATRAAIMSKLTGRPVRLGYDRSEIFRAGVKRHPYRFSISAGMTHDGRVRAWRNTTEVIGGPYNNQAMFANWRSAVHSAGPYATPHVKTDIAAYYTNTPYAGAYRGFGAPQTCFAVESMIDELAHAANLDPAEIRRRNFVRPGNVITCGQVVDPEVMVLPLHDMLEDVLQRGAYDEKRAAFAEHNVADRRHKKGLGLAATYRGCGLGGEGFDVAGALVTAEKDGSVTVHTDLIEMGQGMRTAHAQITAETLGIGLERITLAATDTTTVPDGGPTVASRGLSSGGQAVKNAADTLILRIRTGMANHWGIDVNSVVSNDDRITAPGHSCSFEEATSMLIETMGINLSANGWHNPGITEIDPETGMGNCYPSYLTGVSLTEVSVDIVTGKVTVPRVTMAYEVGRAVNPAIVRGQIVGGYTQGLGYALCEDLVTERGLVRTGGFGSYLMPIIGDAPTFDLTIFEEDPHFGAYGAKGVGEIGVELAAPGIANALFHATGHRFRKLPFTAERLLPVFAQGSAR